MWIFNTDTNMWVKKNDTLNKDDYNNLKQDIAKTQLYSKALSGASYLYAPKTDNLYESLTYKDNDSWYVSPTSSIYNSGTTSVGNPIGTNSIVEYDKYVHEYGFTLKNMFTPIKGIDNINYISVNVATTEEININSTTISIVDGVKLIEGNIVLVKDQITIIGLSSSVDPTTYFSGNYYIVDVISPNTTYYYYNSDNGIYEFKNNSLIKSTFSTYEKSSNLSIYVSNGNINSDSQFMLSRNLKGYFPTENEPIEFVKSHNYLVRNQVDYHNLYENNYYDILVHATQSLVIDGFTYTIPSKILYVGDFGVILNNYFISTPGSTSSYLFNLYKSNLRCITETSKFYWMCGDNGTLLMMSKIDLSITKVNLDELNILNSISFLDEMRGIIVGDYNTIYYTNDGGFNWSKIVFDNMGNYSYNKVIYYSFTTAYISGDNGIFIEINYSDVNPNRWSLVIKYPIKNLTLTDEYELIDDINDMYVTHFDTWGLTYSSYVNEAEGYGITYSMDCLFLVTNNSNIIVYEINNFVTEHDFLYLEFDESLGDLKSITRKEGTDTMVVSGDNLISFDINTFKYTSTTTNVISGTSSLILNTKNYNKIFDYNSCLYGVGNINSAFFYDYSTFFGILSETITPKMLFMEYDMADKLNFFDSNYNYRLPISITFSYTQSSSAISSLTFNPQQDTWLDYLVDSYKTYGVNSDTSTGNMVILNTNFNYGSYSTTFSSSEISISYDDISGLYPIVGSKTSSRYTQFTPVLPSPTYSVFMYDYMSIFKLPNTFCSVGDILQISSDNIEANVMINYGLTTSGGPGGMILSSTISDGGSGYYINDVFRINGGSTNAWGMVTGITGGVSIGTFAGIGTYGFSGDGGVATSAEIYLPMGIGYNTSDGGVYFADALNRRIRMVSSGGTISTISGTNSTIYFGDNILANLASFASPTGLVCDTTGQVYICDESVHVIRKIDTAVTGKIYTIAGSPSVSGFSGDGFDAIGAKFNKPGALCIDIYGNIYVADKGNYRIRKIQNTTNVISTVVGNGTSGYSGDGGPAVLAKINMNKTWSSLSGIIPVGMACDSGANLYFTDINNNSIRKVNYLTGAISTICGSIAGIAGTPIDGALASASYITRPTGITIDSNDNIYFTEGTTHVRKIDFITGRISTIYTVAGLSLAGSLGIGAHNKVYISNAQYGLNNNNIFIVNSSTPTGNVTSYSLLNSGLGYSTGLASTTGATAHGTGLVVSIDSISTLLTSDTYFYAFNDLNQSILNSIKRSATLTIKNLNKFTSASVMQSNFDLHPISDAYKLEYDGYNYTLSPRFNNITAYKSLETIVDVHHSTIDSYDIIYPTTFNQFGYNPNYNLLNYLSNISASFSSSKIFYTMPEYTGLPCNNGGSFTDNNIYYDSNENTNFLRNKLVFGKNLKYEYDTLWINTFVDLTLDTSYGTLNKSQVLITDKYYDSEIGGWALVFSDSLIHIDGLNYYNVDLNSIDIISRNTLGEISEDLRLFNNLNKPLTSKKYNSGGYYSTFYDNPIKTKINTDSYTKILLSDGDIKNNISSIVYTDDKSRLSVNVINVNKFDRFDPFFNYQPISLFDIGNDGMYKIPQILYESNLSIGNTSSLVNFSQNNKTFRLVDGLDIKTLSEKYHWILEAEISDAIIGLDTNGIVWYSGIWHSGRWFGGTWYSGTWYSGDWYTGNWYSYEIIDRINTIEVGKKNVSNLLSLWYNGRWFDGNWGGGTWFNGRWYAGNWKQGTWHNGIWNDGNWETGVFSGGIWVQGTWQNGVFNSYNKPAYWVDGSFYSGDFQNGMWYNGEFGLNHNSNSTFGTLASNSRNATWHGGVWSSGKFYSHKDETDTGVSLVHKYSIWKTGIWNQGDFYGGIVYNTEFNNGNWHGGITQDIEIIGIDLPNSEITINGIFRFNINDYINIINNGSTSSYYNLGNDSNIGRYRIALVRFDLTNNWTTLTLDYIFEPSLFPGVYSSVISNTNTGFKIVSKLKNIPWKSGIWYNGIFDGGSFDGGIWYNGVFLNGGIWGQ